MQKLEFTNGNGVSIDLTDHVNFGITKWSGLSEVGVEVQTQQVPFADGNVYLDNLLSQREINVTVAIQDNGDLERRYELQRKLIECLNPKLGEGVLTYTNDYLSKQIKALPQVPIFPNKNSNESGTLKGSVTFTCCNPFWEDKKETEIYMYVGEETDINNNGDVDTQMKIDIIGESINPIIRNMTKKDFIQLNGNFNKNIHIDTNIGVKSITETDIGWLWIGGGKINSVATNGDINVYVGQQIIIEDINGNITPAVNPTGAELNDICFNGEIFVAVGKNGTIITSSNGKDWIQRISGSSENLNKICFGNNKFVITEESTYYIITSENAIDWNRIRVEIIGYKYNIRYIQGYFYICGTYEHGRIIRSNDVTNWQSVHDFETTNFITDILYDGNVYLSVSNEGIYSSPDLTEWNMIYSLGGNRIRTLVYNRGFYVCLDNELILYSEDLTIWNEVSNDDIGVSDDYFEFSNIKFLNEQFIVTGKGLISTTINFKQWYEKIPFSDFNLLNNINLINNEYIGCGVGIIIVSNDGVKFKKTSFIQARIFNKIILFKDKYILCGKNNYTNANIFIWDKNTLQEINTPVTVELNDVIEVKGQLIAVGDNGTIITSSNGIDWVQRVSGVTENLNKICLSDDLKYLITVGENGCILRSYNLNIYNIDNTGWDRLIIEDTAEINDIIYQNNQFILGGENGLIITISIDLAGRNTINILNNIDSSVTITSIIYDGLQYLLGTSNGSIYISNNLIEFQQQITGVSFSINSLIYDGDKYIGVGEGIINSYIKELNNLISYVSQNSNMNLNLQKGKNRFRFNSDSDNSNLKISYRQKYIGV